MFGYQFFVRAFFCDFAFFQDNNLVGVSYGAEPVCHDDYRLVLEEQVQVVLYGLFVVGVERVGGFVKEQIVRVAVDGACYQQALLLPLAQSLSGVAYFRVVFQRQRFNEVAYVCHFHGIEHPFLVDGLAVGSDVSGYGVAEYESFLHHHSAMLAPFLEADAL